MFVNFLSHQSEKETSASSSFEVEVIFVILEGLVNLSGRKGYESGITTDQLLTITKIKFAISVLPSDKIQDKFILFSLIVIFEIKTKSEMLYLGTSFNQ